MLFNIVLQVLATAIRQANEIKGIQIGREDVVYIHNGIFLSQKKNKIMPFAATWMELETLLLSEIS